MASCNYLFIILIKMKFATYAALMTFASINNVSAAEDQNKLSSEWFVDGARGFYQGYYKSFYKKT